MKHATLLGASFLAFSIATSASAQDASTVVATVGDVEITLGEMIITRAQLPQQYEQFAPEVLFEGILDQLVQQQLLAASMDTVPARVELTVINERRSLLAGERINQLSEAEITEEAIQTAYNKRFDGVEPAQEFNASHLLVETEEEAIAAKARVDGGADFADVARELSTGPTGPNGGNLGWFGAGAMVPEFETAVMALEVGGVSEPVKTQFGWHIVKLNETRLEEQPQLEELRADLTQEVQAEIIETEITALRDATTVVLPEDGAFDPAILTNLDLLDPKSE